MKKDYTPREYIIEGTSIYELKKDGKKTLVISFGDPANTEEFYEWLVENEKSPINFLDWRERRPWDNHSK